MPHSLRSWIETEMGMYIAILLTSFVAPPIADPFLSEFLVYSGNVQELGND